MKYLVDTCILSELIRRNPNPLVVKWFSEHERFDSLYISTVTVGELKQGIAALPEDDSRKSRLARWFERNVLDEYADRILDYDVEVAQKWGDVMGEARRLGCPRPDLDTQIAATALAHGMAMVTRNVDDFQFDGLAVVNPFEPDVRP